MTDILTVIQREKERTHVINLYREGLFYVAYEQSCYAFCKYVRQFKIKKRFIKKINNEIVSLGFPVKSEGKILSGRTVHSVEYGIMIELGNDETVSDDEFLTWKAEVPLAASASLSETGSSLKNTEQHIIEMLRNFPLENRTPLDCMALVGDLKKMLTEKNII